AGAAYRSSRARPDPGVCRRSDRRRSRRRSWAARARAAGARGVLGRVMCTRRGDPGRPRWSPSRCTASPAGADYHVLCGSNFFAPAPPSSAQVTTPARRSCASAPGDGRAPLPQPRVEVVTVRGDAVHRPQRRVDRRLGDGRADHPRGDRDHQFVDVLDHRVAARADDQVQVVVVGVPDVAVAPELTDVDVAVLVAFVARREVEDRGPQTQVRQQPRLEVVELRVVGRSRHVQPPLLDAVLVDSPHEALGVDVGLRGDVERLGLHGMRGRGHGMHASARTAPHAGPRCVSVGALTLDSMAFASEHPVVAHSEFRPVGEIERTEARFEVVSEYEPAGDQPAAIDELERRLRAGEKDVVLLGATGTGKSATTAWLIERVQRPTLVMAPNKTLAAQLANELREMLPHNAVEYFVSYYDYYQPEAYIAQTDPYIETDSSLNEDVER